MSTPMASTAALCARSAAVTSAEASADARWVYACRVSDIVPDTGCGVLVGTHQLAVFRLCDPHTGRERIHALDNVDPFSGTAVLSRGLTGDAGGDVYVASPMYKQRFSLATGRCLDDAAVQVRVHEVRVADGWILVARPGTPTLTEATVLDHGAPPPEPAPGAPTGGA